MTGGFANVERGAGTDEARGGIDGAAGAIEGGFGAVDGEAPFASTEIAANLRIAIRLVPATS